jgi:hypothetical protein
MLDFLFAVFLELYVKGSGIKEKILAGLLINRRPCRRLPDPVSENRGNPIRPLRPIGSIQAAADDRKYSGGFRATAAQDEGRLGWRSVT